MNEENSLKSKILLAEDDGAMRRFLEISLQRAGYEVVSAEDGLAAMQIALTENFDAVITDAVMPNLTGHDLCRILRQNPNFKGVPLIILSGLEQETASDVEHDCADVYLVKNANLKEELTKELTRFIADKA
ncbi:MAG: response regulator [Pyrinomonadaceae bacterium]|nr:response regulator [Pyrinomonadaceae bacterium]